MRIFESNRCTVQPCAVLKGSLVLVNKSAKNLSANEAALIAAILPNPRVYKAKPYSAYINRRRLWIRNQMRNYPF